VQSVAWRDVEESLEIYSRFESAITWVVTAHDRSHALDLLRRCSREQPGEFVLFQGSDIVAIARDGIVSIRRPSVPVPPDN
jgi:hypothetical protein